MFKFCGFGILSLSSPEALFPRLLDGSLASIRPPIGTHKRPKSSQNVSKTAPRGSKTPPRGLLEPPRTLARAPRNPPELPRCLQEAPGTLQGSILTLPGAIWSSIFAPEKARRSCKTILETLTCNLWLQGLGRRVSAKRIQFHSPNIALI